HTSHARHLVEHLVRRYGPDVPVDLGPRVLVRAPIVQTVCGILPCTLGDFDIALDYLERELTHLTSSLHMGQEGDHLDFESKTLHAGMIDSAGMEIADIAQIIALGLPKGDPEAPLVDIGLGVIDSSKPVVMCVGHNVSSGVEIIDHLTASRLRGSVEVCGLCCTGHDIARYGQAKIVGPISQQIRFVRSGVADAIVVDEQCMHLGLLAEAQAVKAPLIATSEKACFGLPDRTADPVEDIVRDLVLGRSPGALILDMEKVGQVAPQVAIQVAPRRRELKALPSREEIAGLAKRCVKCGRCRRSCPNDLPIDVAVEEAGRGNPEPLSRLYERCVGCGRCESACRSDLPLISMMSAAAERQVKTERYRIRVGRGPILDTEIREVGAPIVLGAIPGVIAIVGCANFPRGWREVPEMCEEFLRRKYIVTTSGCSAMAIAMYRTADGRGIYESYPGAFDMGNIANCGSCVANAHIIGAAVKIAAVFARRNLRANYEEIADYILNRVGACGIVWGSMSQKAFAIATGCNRWGIPVIVGPHGLKYRRLLLGRRDREEGWYSYDVRTGKRIYVGPAPEHLYYAAETKEEAIVMAAKLCIRPSDTTKGRQIKLTNYVALHERFFGKLPDDLHLFVRTEADVPIPMKFKIMEYLDRKGWEPRPTRVDITLVPRLVRRRGRVG
ncbi:TPA: CO dehydrogenase/acetyl-CoA synthase complex subunit epsilon, partial [Candidatus Bathyarchaeota archaeon]|nr:CO dehydrogenase/acetyl-CoA synthase complex subunit epsilon [Candidatus Bathyarchaeota archaeon]